MNQDTYEHQLGAGNHSFQGEDTQCPLRATSHNSLPEGGRPEASTPCLTHFHFLPSQLFLFFLIHVFVLAISLAPYYIKRNCVCVCAHVYHMQMPVEAEKNLGSCELPDVGAGTECESSVRTHVLLTAELSSPRVHYIISLCS